MGIGRAGGSLLSGTSFQHTTSRLCARATASQIATLYSTQHRCFAKTARNAAERPPNTTLKANTSRSKPASKDQNLEDLVGNAFLEFKNSMLQKKKNEEALAQMKRPGQNADAEYSSMFPGSESPGRAFGWGEVELKSPLEKWQDEIKEMDTNLDLGAKTGRQLWVYPTSNADLGRKLASLGGLTSRNGLKAMLRQQREHERPGLKRKRLRRERWRARFKANFDRICDRATHLAKQGW